MKTEKQIATSLVALMVATSTFVVAALANHPLSQYPGFFGALNLPYIVVGASAQTSDVVGAVDIMAGLAALSTSPSSGVGGGCSGVSGKCTDAARLGSSGDTVSSLLGTEITQTQFPTLFRGGVDFDGKTFTVLERIQSPNAKVKIDTSTISFLNGTPAIDTSSATKLVYNYTPVSAITNTSNAISATNTINIVLLGKTYKISSLGTNAITAFSGATGTVTATTPLTCTSVAGCTGTQYSFYSDLGSNGAWARILVKDASGNTIQTLIIDQGKKATCTSCTPLLDVVVNSVRALTDGTIVGTDIVVGLKDKTTTTVNDGDANADSDIWQWKISSDSTHLNWIALQYVGTQNASVQYIPVGNMLVSPGNTFQFGFPAFKLSTIADITVTIDSISVYNDTTSNSIKAGFSSVPTLKIASSIPLFNSQNSKVAYIAVNSSGNGLALAYWDDSISKAVISGNVVATTATITINGKYDTHTFTVVKTTNALTTTDGGSGAIVAGYNWDNTASQWRLGITKASAEASDVNVSWDAGVSGTWDHTTWSDFGTALQMVKTNAESDKLSIMLPSAQQTAVIYIGTATGGQSTGTQKVYTPITAPVARLDTEDTSGKNLILVGGSAINRLTAAAWGVSYPTLGSQLPSSVITRTGLTGSGHAVIETIDYPSSHESVVVAGWDPTDTRAASNALELYSTKLAGTGTVVKLTVSSATSYTIS